MNEKLLECLGLVNEMMCDVNEEYPIALRRVRYLIAEMIDDEAARLLARRYNGSNYTSVGTSTPESAA